MKQIIVVIILAVFSLSLQAKTLELKKIQEPFLFLKNQTGCWVKNFLACHLFTFLLR